ncbi:phosphate ABC transporter substrate-binding protein PstS [Stieleria sp. TO1_6]|uniref:phosphate ABC transporter substrate-binding protein PstS n=1 Tax=Stieleria tagensis TaxID=2956795 RepID=UPI00209B0DD8|nr:phosphate ABC transporter substrate-binding protein PstS [Stieleria tagensis]MCO8122195.1 phosphate ABC transporter substrate-binding protein PstS [Stieleria tagensis]
MTIRSILFTSLSTLVCVLSLGCGSAANKDFVKLQGAGASFPAPLYNKWLKEYSAAHDDVQIDYQSVGSGQGVKSVIDHTVDFGASDAAMKPSEMEQVDGGVQLLPMTAGSVVLAYNLEGVDGLKLSREAYVNILLGKITQWNDPAIVATNDGVELPDLPINVVVRSDSSGTTYVFTKHLAEINSEFAESVGVEKAPNWPVGTKSKGNEGVTASITTTPGSIGYIEFGYAKGAKLEMASLENKAGNFIKPSIESAQSAMAAVQMPDDLIAWLPDPEGDEAYPIVTYTWIICYRSYSDAKKVEALKAMLNYCLTDGQASSEQLGYIPLPATVVEKVKAALDNITVSEPGPAA